MRGLQATHDDRNVLVEEVGIQQPNGLCKRTTLEGFQIYFRMGMYVVPGHHFPMDSLRNLRTMRFNCCFSKKERGVGAMSFQHIRSRALVSKDAMKRIEIINVDWSDAINWDVPVVEDWISGIEWGPVE
jgi:hypothetical protein